LGIFLVHLEMFPKSILVIVYTYHSEYNTSTGYAARVKETLELMNNMINDKSIQNPCTSKVLTASFGVDD
jgi:hypothetical protein